LFINIHTHFTPQNEEWSIQNIHENFEQLNPLFNYSVGIHPWHININSVRDELLKMEIASKSKNVWAIGECGLDRICETPFKWQQEIFTNQVLWANQIAKPIIIHCVRAHREVLSILKECKNHMPVVFHGFNNNYDVAEDIINAGGYLSFGKALFNPNIQKIFSKISTNKIFLETDQSECSIDSIYKQASKIKQVSTAQMSNQIFQNFKETFKPAN
jgi:TatD DNase family protein